MKMGWLRYVAVAALVVALPVGMARAAVIGGPNDVSGLAVWLDSHNADGQDNTLAGYAENDRVTWWKNLSTDAASIGDFTAAVGEGPYYMGTVSNQAHGPGGMMFRNSENTYVKNVSAAAKALDGEMTIFAIWEDAGKTTRSIVCGSDGSTTGWWLEVPRPYSDFELFGGGYVRSNNAGGLGQYGCNLIEASAADAGGGMYDLAIRMNGEVVDPGVDDTPVYNTTAGVAYTDQDTGVFVGMFPTGLGDAKGWLTELIVYDHALTAAERESVGYYLQSKWGGIGTEGSEDEWLQTDYVPEPASLGLLALGGIGLLLRRRR